jgi:hypothetical protein
MISERFSGLGEFGEVKVGLVVTDLHESLRGYVGVRNYLFLGRLFFEVPNGNNFVSGEPNIFDDEPKQQQNELSRE